MLQFLGKLSFNRYKFIGSICILFIGRVGEEFQFASFETVEWCDFTLSNPRTESASRLNERASVLLGKTSTADTLQQHKA